MERHPLIMARAVTLRVPIFGVHEARQSEHELATDRHRELCLRSSGSSSGPDSAVGAAGLPIQTHRHPDPPGRWD